LSEIFIDFTKHQQGKVGLFPAAQHVRVYFKSSSLPAVSKDTLPPLE